jgi:hypothetical protein
MTQGAVSAILVGKCVLARSGGEEMRRGGAGFAGVAGSVNGRAWWWSAKVSSAEGCSMMESGDDALARETGWTCSLVSKYIEQTGKAGKQASKQAAEVLTYCCCCSLYTRPETAQHTALSAKASLPLLHLHRGLTAAQMSSSHIIPTIPYVTSFARHHCCAWRITCSLLPYTPRDLMSDPVTVLASHHCTQWTPP